MNPFMKTLLLSHLFLISYSNAQTPIDNDFTYQGELIFNNQLVTGDYDFAVTAFDAIIDGTDYDAPYSVDAIPVVNGIFTLPLDFGDAPFMGNEVFLEIGVRLNGSGLPFETLSPRQKLTSSPYAIHAQFVGVNAIGSAEIRNGTIITEDLADDSITAAKLAGNAVDTEALQDGAVAGAKIAANTVGTVAVNNTQIQTRVSGSCIAGEFMSVINQDGTVVCNVDNTGSTTVTSVDIVDGAIQTVDLANNSISNAKLVDDVITPSKISPDAVTSTAIANGAVGASEIAVGAVGESAVNSTKVQLRVTGACGNGEFLKSVNQDGTVVCDTDNSGLTSVTSTDIVNGTIAAIDIGFEVIEKDNIQNGAVSGSKIATNAVGTVQINSTQVQSRVSGNCTAGSFIGSINQDGTVNCSVDNTGITSVTSADIVDGTITNNDIANDAITGSKIINNAIGLSEMANDSVGSSEVIDRSIQSGDIAFNAVGVLVANTNEIQARVNSTCNDGYYMIGVNQDGSVNCQELPFGLDNASDTLNNDGRHTSIVIRPSSGLPIISYQDQANGSLNVFDCSNTRCSQGTVRVLDSNGTVGLYTKIIIRPSTGRPIISYHDLTNKDLKVYNCFNINCSSGMARTLDATDDTGLYTSMSLHNNGWPSITYYDETYGDLKVYNCFNANCTSGSWEILDSADNVGKYTSTVTRSNSNLIISYYDETNTSLKMIYCNNTSCSSSNDFLIDNSASVGKYSKLVFDSFGYPKVAYYNQTNGSLKMYDCDDASCLTGVFTTLDNNGSVGEDIDFVLSDDGTPVISYYDKLNHNLKIYHCVDAACFSGTAKTLDSVGFVGQYTGIAIGQDGNPIISYFDDTNDNLKIYSCTDQECFR